MRELIEAVRFLLRDRVRHGDSESSARAAAHLVNVVESPQSPDGVAALAENVSTQVDRLAALEDVVDRLADFAAGGAGAPITIKSGQGGEK